MGAGRLTERIGETYGHSRGQGISLPTTEPEVHGHVHISPIIIPIMRQLNPVRTLIVYLYNNHFITIVTSTSNSLK
jgi:hypothetical protein